MKEEKNIQLEDTIRQERPRLLSFLRNRLRIREDAEDLLQDVWYELVESTRLVEPVEQATAWLFRVARNKLIDRNRKKKPELLEDVFFLEEDEEESYTLADLLPGIGLDPEESVWQQDFSEALDEALDELPEEQRLVFVEQELNGRSFRELSEELGEPVNTLISRKRYAVLYLREQLSDLYEDLLDG